MTCEMPTDVMEPTIRKGSIVAIDTAYYYKNEPDRWDIAVFTSPEVEQMKFALGRQKVNSEAGGGIVNAAAEIFEEKQVLLRPHLFFMKRVVSLEGERIRFSEANIFIDGKELHIPRDISSCYSRFDDFMSYKCGAEEYTIPHYSVFVLSDNVAKGKDSRHFGGVSLHNMIGRVVL